MIKGKNILRFISWYLFLWRCLCQNVQIATLCDLMTKENKVKTKDIRVNKELIMKYRPCPDGLDNFNKYYKDISIKELINSKKISYKHKVWLLRRITPTDLLVLWSIDSAFAAYEYSDTTNRAAYYAEHTAYHAEYAANAEYTAYYAGYAAYYAVRAAEAVYYAFNSAFFKDNAQDERLQALLYFIETEGE